MYSCVVIWGSLFILTVSFVLILSIVTIQVLVFAFCCVQLCNYMGWFFILTLSVVFTSDPVTIQMLNISLCCVQSCSYMGKFFHFDSFRFMNPKSFRHAGVLRCFMVCTVV